MRNLIVTQNITLDGVIELIDGWFHPVGGDPKVDQTDLETALRTQREAADAFVVGRVTFEQMRGYWPLQTDDSTGTRDYLNTVSKYVFSHTLEDPQWAHTTVLRGALADEIQTLKSLPGKDIVTTGSMLLVQGLIAAGLVDEYRLFMHPIVLGHGQRLFAGATASPRLTLVETQPLRSGIVLLRYRTA